MRDSAKNAHVAKYDVEYDKTSVIICDDQVPSSFLNILSQLVKYTLLKQSRENAVTTFASNNTRKEFGNHLLLHNVSRT